MKEKIAGTLGLLVSAGILYFAFLQLDTGRDTSRQFHRQIETQASKVTYWFSSLLERDIKKPLRFEAKSEPKPVKKVEPQPEVINTYKKKKSSEFLKGSDREDVAY